MEALGYVGIFVIGLFLGVFCVLPRGANADRERDLRDYDHSIRRGRVE